MTEEELARAVGVPPAVVSEWERDESRPTAGQFSRLAQVLQRPTALFFLPQPPRRESLPTRFRRAPGLAGHELSKEEIRQIRWARRIEEIVAWILRDRGEGQVALPRFSVQARTQEAAATLRQLLGISTATQMTWESASEAFRAWRAVLEQQGVLVLQLQMGRGSIRGFSAWDDWAPIAAVNTAYHPTARIFTLFHEVGHLITRTDAACTRFILPSDSEVAVERWCERFAAEFLVPAEALRTVASSLGVAERRSVQEGVQVVRRIAARFKVSVRAVSLRLQEIGMAPPTLYNAVVREFEDLDWNPSGGGGGQSAPVKRLGQLGERIPGILFDASSEGRITDAELADYLHLTIGQLDELRSLVGTHA